MHKYSFLNDYSEGAHPAILELLTSTNHDQHPGYGEDVLTTQATDLIQQAIQNPTAAIHLVSGGTQANLIILASLLKPYEAVIAARTAHIHVHEAGAIEATGHRIQTIDTPDGKLTPNHIQQILSLHEDEHTVISRAVFISNSTEFGTIYTKSELQALYQFCQEHQLYLHLDGARLGSGLCASNSDLTIADVAQYTDVFYIGGTKNGALIGEAIVINNPELQPNFRYHLKQRGALLAKGRLLGAQFVPLFTNNLYFDLATHANTMAAQITTGITELGYRFLSNSTTNQIFPILPHNIISELQKSYGFYIWKKIDDSNSAIRLVTSWATQETNVREFLTDITALTRR